MNLELTDEQRLAIESLRKFLDTELEPAITAHGESKVPKEQMRAWTIQLAQFGLINAPFPVEWGGLGLDWKTHLLLWEELAFSSVAVALSVGMNCVAADFLIRNAPQAIVEKWVPGVLAGELIASMGVSEPDVGSDVSAAKTRAVRDGDEWVINGEKTWISNGSHADFFICTCKTGEGELTHIFIEREAGYEVRDINKIALNGTSLAQVFLSDVRVPVANTIGQVGVGLKNTLVTFERARCHMGAWGYGIARRAMHE